MAVEVTEPYGAEGHVHQIFDDLPEHQQALVDIIGDQWQRNGRWPVYDYIERTFRRQTGLSSLATMAQLPVVGRYFMLFDEDGQPWGNPDRRVGLTAAGFYHFPQLRDHAVQLVTAVRLIADRDAHLTPDPERVVKLDLTIEGVFDAIDPWLSTWSPADLGTALRQEPPLWGALVDHPPIAEARSLASSKRIRPDHRLSGFVGVSGLDDYLCRVVRLLGAGARPPVEAQLPSALGLAEALGYLDAVWRVQAGSHLLGHVNPSAAAKLAASCSSPDEFDARLSALADILAGVRVELAVDAEKAASAAGEKSLARLRRRLEAELERDAFARASETVSDLQRAVRVRAAGQHSGAMSEMAGTFERFGVKYPPMDWGMAWEQVRARCAAAVNAIREELEVRDQAGEGRVPAATADKP